MPAPERQNHQADNHASTSSLKNFYRPDALPDIQQAMSKH